MPVFGCQFGVEKTKTARRWNRPLDCSHRAHFDPPFDDIEKVIDKSLNRFSKSACNGDTPSSSGKAKSFGSKL
jgi:hypothetical protein